MRKNKQILWMCFYVIIVFILIVFVFSRYRTPHHNKDAIFYCYFEKNEMYKDNFTYFLQHVVLPEHKTIDIFIIINGECSVPLPTLPNVKIIRRKNHGYDFGAYSHCITHHVKKDYDYYIFINTSVRGPVPPHVDWRKKFKELFKEDVGLVGVTINMVGKYRMVSLSNGRRPPIEKDLLTHVQSTFFILRRDAFLYLKHEKKFFSDEELLNKSDMWDVVMKKEIGMSQFIFEGGWNINCILPKYQGHDYRILENNINTYSDHPYCRGCYFGKDLKQEEAIFPKISWMT